MYSSPTLTSRDHRFRTAEATPKTVTRSTQIVFIDRQLTDYAALAAGVLPDIEVYLLDPNLDGVRQITQVLARYDSISSIHLVSHGSAGRIQLGSRSLSIESIDRYAIELQQWAANLAPDAELYIYGCEVGKGELGAALVYRLSEFLGVSVAASATKTGNAEFGGDWELTVSTGKQPVRLAFAADAMSAYQGVMPTINGTPGDDNLQGDNNLLTPRLNDTINGGDGNDTINGGLGQDTVDGGAGTDTLIVDYSSNTNGGLVSSIGQDANGYNGIIYAYYNGSGNYDQIQFSGIEKVQITGTQLNDVFGGLIPLGSIDGGAGIDTLHDADFSKLTNAATNVNDSGNITVSNGTVLKNFEQFDNITTGTGNDTVNLTSRHNENINTGDGNDTINGGLGVDNIDGGAGNDTLIVDYSSNTNGGIVSSLAQDANGTSYHGNLYAYYNGSGNYDQANFSNIEKFQITGTTFDDVFDTTLRGSTVDAGLGTNTLKNADFSGLATNENVNDGGDLQFSDGTVLKNFKQFDNITTGTGNDTIDLTTRHTENISTGAGDDIINAGLGIDNIDGGAGTDLLIVDYSANTNGGIISSIVQDANGTSYHGNLYAYYNGSGNYDQANFSNIEKFQITGTKFDDVFDTTLRGSTVDAGAGNNTLINADFSGLATNENVNDAGNLAFSDGTVLKNFQQFNNITTGTGNDVINLTTRHNENISTGAGDDTINAGLGIDNIDGGAGNDTLIVDYSANTNGGITSSIVQDANGTSYHGNLYAYYNGSGNYDQANFSNIEKFQITGTKFDDVFDTTLRGSTVDAGAGTNTLKNADFSGLVTNETVNESGNLQFTDGTVLKNFKQFDNITTGTGNDTINLTTRHTENISTGAGDDTINAGLGIDNIDGGAGNDTLIVDYSANTNGGITSSIAQDANGTSYHGNLYAYYNGSGNYDQANFSNIEKFQITGTQFADNIQTAAGNDTLIGGGGADLLSGGDGDDTYIVDRRTGGGTVIDDALGTNDTLSLIGVPLTAQDISRNGTTLLVDLNQDSIFDPGSDLSIKNYFATDTGSKAGAGFIENMGSLSGADIQKAYSHPVITGFPNGAKGSNKGQTTIVIAGQNFSPADQIALKDINGTEKAASKVYWVSSSEIWATFDLQGLATGNYKVGLKNATENVTSGSSFSVTDGAVGSIQTTFNYTGNGYATLQYTNTGQTDLISPLFRVTGTNVQLNAPIQDTSSPTLSKLLHEFVGKSDSGPAGILAAGKSGQVSIAYTPIATGVISLAVEQVPSTEIIDWATIKAESRADYSFIDSAAWDEIWTRLTAKFGTTVGDFQKVISAESTYLSQLGQPTNNLSRLFNFAFNQADNALVNSKIISTTDIADKTPGLSLSFNRTFNQSLAERYNLGTLGRGWSSQWEQQATTNAQGDVVIRGVGNLQRFFQLQTDGTYLEVGGATLTVTAGQYRLKETTGNTELYGTDGKLNSVQDPNGNRISLQYTSGLLTKLVHTNGDSLSLTYNPQGRISQITDSTGQASSYSYDATGQNLLSVTTPQGTTAYTYDTGSVAATKYSLLSATTGQSYQQTFQYDSLGRLTQQSKNGGTQAVTYSYDSNGAVTATDSIGAAQTVLLNDSGEIGQLRGVNNQNSTFGYAAGNLTSATLPNGGQTAYTYDTSGNLTQQTDLLGKSTQFTYSPNFNRLTGFTDPKGNGISYTYDAKGNINKLTYADGSTTQIGVDAVGNITSTVNRLGSAIQYTYNKDGLVTQKTYPDGSNISYGYDAKGNLTGVTDASGKVTMQYDTANHLTSVAYPNGRSIQYTYNANGQRTQLVEQDGNTVNYSYDTVGHLKTLTNSTGQSIVSYDYSVGRLAKETNGNGTYTTYTYDQQGQLTNLVNYTATNTVNSSFAYTYNNVGQRTSMTTLDGTSTYGYDAAGQLIAVSTPTRSIRYQYDVAGNRTNVFDNAKPTNYSTNNLNEYTSVGNAVYTYDTDGNLTSKTQGGQTSNYTYDVENRLAKVVTPQGTWDYKYDALGNRTATIANGQRTDYLVDPTGLGNVVGQYDSSGKLIADYNYGLGLVNQTNGTNSNYYDADALGSIVGLSGANGSYVDSYSYLPFGESLTKLETVANPFQYVGQYGVTTEGNGLDSMGARFYDPNLGRFTSNDPIGFQGGLNLYAYTSNSPTNFVDPSGLKTVAWGLSATGGLGDVGGTVGVSLVWDGSSLVPNIQLTVGGGVFTGNGGGFGGNGTYTNAANAYDLTGPGGQTGASGGEGVTGGYDYITGDGYTGHSVNVGLGGSVIPVEGHAFKTQTWDITQPIVDYYSQVPDPFTNGNPQSPGNPRSPDEKPEIHSWGDPHLTTADGTSYDFQIAGEFTFLKSTTDDFEIQVRQKTFNPGGPAFNTAIALQSGGQKVEFDAGQNKVVLNGVATDIPDQSLYAVGTKLIMQRSGNSYTIYTANNDSIQIDNNGSYLNIDAAPDSNRVGKLFGVVASSGYYDSDDDGVVGAGGFALRDGTVIGNTITNAQLYGVYADSWRISQSDSLFTYPSGTSTTTFTDKTPPTPIVITPAQTAAAQQAATNAGITDPTLLADAIFDQVVTNNDPQYLTGYTALQRQATTSGSDALINPDGSGSQFWVGANTFLPNTIRFTNTAATGTTPIAKVNVTQQLDTDLNLDTFTFNDIVIGDTTVKIPAGSIDFSKRIDLQSTAGVLVDITASLNAATRTVTWTFNSIDPTTGVTANSATKGFLLPSGLGTVGYTVQPIASSPTNTRIDAQASITFNGGTPVLTTPVFNTIDSSLPTSSVNALSASSSTNFNVSWGGTDNESGIGSYNIFVAADGGQYTPWQTNTTATAATYTGLPGHQYAFYSVGVDNANNVEAAPLQADASTQIAGRNDFNGDGKSDILWRNEYGSVALWQMNGSTVTSGSLTSAPDLDPSWKVAGTGDFNGDGKADILWRNTNGSIDVWTMNGSTVISSNLTSTPSLDASWKTIGTGDYNGDGKSDILWRNTNGAVAVWTMNGSTVTSSTLTSTPSLDSSWKVAGNSDFNGDGKADILWRNDDGTVALWQMNGAGVSASTAVAKVAADWKISGTGDFNGDGKSDILWRNDDGRVVLWQMNGAAITSRSLTSTPSRDISWTVAGIDDYNGDGKADILWRKDSGATDVWAMNGATVVSSTLTSIAADSSSWKIAAPIL